MRPAGSTQMRTVPHPWQVARDMELLRPRSRRSFLGHGVAGLSTLMFGRGLVGCSSEPAPPVTKLVSNLHAIGPLGEPNADGLRLPPGFTARIVAVSGEIPVAAGRYVWHVFPDGGATFPTPDGGWIYVSNCEFPFLGGAGALRFDEGGQVIAAYPILEGTNVNCAGGATPWGTWLSCEEVERGRVFECDPFGKKAAVELPALGIFQHEAAVVDPLRQHVYLTEDEADGLFYRFTPAAYPSLTTGTLEVMQAHEDGRVEWHALPDPQYLGETPTRMQVPQATRFTGGEGLFCFERTVYFTTKGDHRVWALDVEAQKLSVLYDMATAANPILKGVDNLTGTCCGDILVAEDAGDMEVVAILADGRLLPLVQVMGQDESEITGPAFDPSGTRLYFSSQRGGDGAGLTYEVTGPFHLSV